MAAARIARFLRPAVQAQTAAGLAAMDAYNFLPMLNNYLFAAAAAPALEAEPAPLPCQEEGERHFPEAGLYFKSTGAYYAILGLSKGGTLKVFDRASGRLAGSDCGYWARINDGRIVGSQSLDRTRPVSREVEGFTIEAPFVQVNQQVPAPWLFVGFRLFSLTLGRVPALAAWLKRLLVQVLVSRRRVVDLRLSRRVRFEPDRVRLADRIIRPPAMTVRQLRAGAKFATIHMGSSRYFQPQELEGETVETADWARDLMAQGTLSIDRTLAPAAAPGEEAG